MSAGLGTSQSATVVFYSLATWTSMNHKINPAKLFQIATYSCFFFCSTWSVIRAMLTLLFYFVFWGKPCTQQIRSAAMTSLN